MSGGDYYPRLPVEPTGIVVFSVCPSVCTSVCPELCYHSNFLRISAIGLKIDGMMHSTMKQIAI